MKTCTLHTHSEYRLWKNLIFFKSSRASTLIEVLFVLQLTDICGWGVMGTGATNICLISEFNTFHVSGLSICTQ